MPRPDRQPWQVIARVDSSPTRTGPGRRLRSARLPRGTAFGLAVVSGLLVSLSLPPFGWWPLGLVGLAGFSALLAATATRPGAGRARGARSRAAIGAGFGIGLYSLSL